MERIKISIKFITWILLSILFFWAIVFWACNTSTTPQHCTNTQWWSYNNADAIQDQSSLVYLKMFNLPNLSCDDDSQASQAANRVKQIQWSMKTNCNFDCEDGFFWNDTSTALTNCANTYCSGKWTGFQTPTLSWENLVCEEWYILDSSKCCKNSCDHPQVNNSCNSYGSGYYFNWTCCALCDYPSENGSCDKYGSGYQLTWENGCCRFNCSVWKSCRTWQVWSTWVCGCVCNPDAWCCGVQLNIPIPFIWDCIELTSSNDLNGGAAWSLTVNQLNAFPYLIQWISKILVTLIMIFSIIIVIVAWLMMTTSVASEQNYKKWLDMLQKVLVALILLGTSWLILKLINPNFFGW